ncbi:MAG: polysaccharide pyruvyl transferase family protein [Thermodesulfobacteriota bacterium]
MILSDAEIARQVLARMRRSGQASLLPSDLHPYSVVDLYRHLDLVVSMRHHANAFALRHHVPILGLDVGEKIATFFQEAGWDDALVDPWSSPLPDLCALADRLLAERPARQAAMAAELAARRQDLARTLNEALAGV